MQLVLKCLNLNQFWLASMGLGEKPSYSCFHSLFIEWWTWAHMMWLTLAALELYHMLSLALRERGMMRTVCLIATWSLVLTMMSCMLGDPFSYGPNRRHGLNRMAWPEQKASGFELIRRVFSMFLGGSYMYLLSSCMISASLCTQVFMSCCCDAVMVRVQQDSSDRLDFTVDLLSCYKVWNIKRLCVQGMKSTNDVGVDTGHVWFSLSKTWLFYMCCETIQCTADTLLLSRTAVRVVVFHSNCTQLLSRRLDAWNNAPFECPGVYLYI